jgi:hypothetical protein
MAQPRGLPKDLSAEHDIACLPNLLGLGGFRERGAKVVLLDLGRLLEDLDLHGLVAPVRAGSSGGPLVDESVAVVRHAWLQAGLVTARTASRHSANVPARRRTQG